MATFFDKKQDVMSVELTPYGKYLLSKGKFKPTFYSFHDDEVTYDVTYGSTSEEQNNSVDRIKTTPTIKPLYNFSGSYGYPAAYGHEKSQMAINDTTLSLTRPLGTSDGTKDKQPSWEVTVLPESVKISGSVTYSSPHERAEEIPQIEMVIENVYSEDDGIQFLSSEQQAVLQTRERNVIWDRFENYDIEVFVTDEEGSITRQLSFVNDKNPEALSAIAANLRKAYESGDFLSETEDEIENDLQALDETYVEYYLDLRVDREIEDLETPPATPFEIGEHVGIIDLIEDIGDPDEEVCD